MGTKDLQAVVQRLQRLERLVDTYGHLLTAAELDRSLPALVPVLAAGEVSPAEAGGLLQEILRRGPAQLLADLEEFKRIAGAAKDGHIYGALNRVRDAFLHVVRYNAATLLRRLEQGEQDGLAVSLQKEVQAFTQSAARAVPVPTDEVDEIFADEELLGLDRPAAPPEDDPALSAEPPEEPGAVAGPPEESAVEVAATFEKFVAPPWAVHAEDSASAIEWMRDRIEVFNEMLRRWAAGERLDAEASPLVRRGRLSAERCRSLYRELLEAGAVPLVDRLARHSGANGDEGDQARALRGRIVDGAVGSIPRLLSILSSGGHLHTGVDGARGDPDRVLADLAEYVARAADLFDVGSPLRERLLYLAGELRTVTNL